MTFDELLETTFALSFPEGQPENLVRVHRAFVVEALWNIQSAVPCLLINSTNQFPHCSSYFNCGFTVIPKPDGQITEIFVIDRIHPDTGLEDPEAASDWCSKVWYTQTDWCNLQGYSRLCERCSSSSAGTAADSIASAVLGVFRRKRAYPRPTNVGLESLPTLPEGFSYPQTSTDAAGRSPSGRWAIRNGRIYVVPWIQSTETLVIKSIGKKRKWSGADLVEDDPQFQLATRLHFQIQHEQSFGDDPGKLQRLKYALYGGPDEVGAIPLLIHECNEQNRIKRCVEAGVAGMSSAARGIGVNTNPSSAFTNDQRIDYTAECPEGKTGNSVRVVIEPGEVGSALSVADANARASQQAADDANARLICVDAATVYHNTNAGQPYTAYCPSAYINDDGNEVPAAEGAPSTVLRAAYTSTASEQAANDRADADAQRAAELGLNCTFWNALQTYTAICTANQANNVTRTVDAHTKSAQTQAGADALALAEATNLANAALVLTCGTQVYWNTQIKRGPTPVSCVRSGGCVYTVTTTIILEANRFTSSVSQAHAQALAQSYFNQELGQPYANPCQASDGCFNQSKTIYL